MGFKEGEVVGRYGGRGREVGEGEGRETQSTPLTSCFSEGEKRLLYFIFFLSASFVDISLFCLGLSFIIIPSVDLCGGMAHFF